MSHHSKTRQQQRGIPPMIEEWLDRYGEEVYDGHGGVVLFFNKKSRRKLEHDFGREPVRRCSEWLDAYKVLATDSGETLTVGHRYKRIVRH